MTTHYGNLNPADRPEFKRAVKFAGAYIVLGLLASWLGASAPWLAGTGLATTLAVLALLNLGWVRHLAALELPTNSMAAMSSLAGWIAGLAFAGSTFALSFVPAMRPAAVPGVVGFGIVLGSWVILHAWSDDLRHAVEA